MPWRTDPSASGAALAKTGAIIVVILGLIGALTVAMPSAYRVSRSVAITAAPSDVFPHVNDFHKWKAWTPWLDDDPNAKVTIDGAPGKGATYQWVGNGSVGEGKITILESDANERIKLKLDFVRPMVRTAEAVFTCKKEDDKTLVTWTFVGERDLVGKALGAVMSMEAMIGGRFDEGLKRMKAVGEGKEPRNK
ncbi:MAG: SRPBCC family protein [Planctomycetes bacterium]|nr:SRPBCC family protein [Planctomycetota bacterium]